LPIPGLKLQFDKKQLEELPFRADFQAQAEFKDNRFRIIGFWGRSQDLKFRGYPGCSQNFKFLFVTVTNITILWAGSVLWF
jgi:hypothetical protein